jgi:predicted Zn finger-like uncharacterized protein
MSNVRLRRLQADFEKLSDYVKRHPRLKIIQADGEPPERYQLEFRIRSLRQVNDDLVEIKSHMVEIALPRNYPRTPPQCRMLTPVFHPNIAPHAICVGDHWSAGEPLASLVARIGEMLAFQSYNVKSPLNGEAARWVEQNLDQLPLDPVSLLVEESEETTSSAPSLAVSARPRTVLPRSSVTTAAPPSRPAPSHPASDGDATPETSTSVVLSVSCPGCGTSYRVNVKPGLRRARCKNCQTVFDLPIEG